MGIGDMLQAQQDAEDAARYRWLKAQFELDIEKRDVNELVESKGNRNTYESRTEYWCIFRLIEDWRFGKTQDTDKLDFDKVVDELRAAESR